MSQTANKPVEVGVVLQGGGALGAYECGALNALLELIDEFSAKGHRILLKVVSGVSIGSINAACVVGAKSNADARARLNALWDDLTLETPPFWMQAAQRDLAYFGLPGFYVSIWQAMWAPKMEARVVQELELNGNESIFKYFTVCIAFPPRIGEMKDAVVRPNSCLNFLVYSNTLGITLSGFVQLSSLVEFSILCHST